MESRLSTSSSSHNCNGPLRKEAQVGGKNLKPHSTPATLLWLEENYEIAEGVCVPRNTLYLHYVDFCAKNSMQPVNAASFGKIIRQQFPQLTTRRLGTRGQSRYHYYGIAIRETSAYYELIYSKKGIQAPGDLRKDQVRQVPAYAPRGKMAASLPEFPSLRDLCLPAHVPEDRVATFIMMYRAHCQRLLDTVIRASFDEVQTFLLHFWQGMPPHLMGILGTNVVVNIVGVCDSILYRSVCSILMPSIVRTLPEALVQVIRKFATDLDSWLTAALEDLPENLRNVKSELARHFCHMLRRQASLNQVMQATRVALHDPQLPVILLHDWRHLDLQQNVRSAVQMAAVVYVEDYPVPHLTSHQTSSDILITNSPCNSSPSANKRHSVVSNLHCSSIEFIGGLCVEFERLLQEQVPIEAFTEWLESVVERCIVQNAQHKRLSLRQAAKNFLASWTALSTRILRDLSLHSAPSFGSFNLLRLMADDYLLYLVELLHMNDQARELMRNISMDAAPEFTDSDYETLVARMYNISSNASVSTDLLHDINPADMASHSSPTTHAYTILADDPAESAHHTSTQHSSSVGGCLSNDMDPDASQTSIMAEYVHMSDSPASNNCNGYAYDSAEIRGAGNGYKFSGGYMYVSNGQPQGIPYSLAVLGPQADVPNGDYAVTYPGAQYSTFRRDFADANAGTYYPESVTYPAAVHTPPEYYAAYDVPSGYESANTPRPKSLPEEVKQNESEEKVHTTPETYLPQINSSVTTPYLRS